MNWQFILSLLNSFISIRNIGYVKVGCFEGSICLNESCRLEDLSPDFIGVHLIPVSRSSRIEWPAHLSDSLQLIPMTVSGIKILESKLN